MGPASLAASARYGFLTHLQAQAESWMGWTGSKWERKIIAFGERKIIKISMWNFHHFLPSDGMVVTLRCLCCDFNIKSIQRKGENSYKQLPLQ